MFAVGTKKPNVFAKPTFGGVKKNEEQLFESPVKPQSR